MKYLFVIKTFLIACLLANFGEIELLAQTTVTDELTSVNLGLQADTYASFTDKKITSAALYAGNAMKGVQDAIQMRKSNDSQDPSAIVTTLSGGTVRKIIVEWNPNTTSEHTLEILGKSTAYKSASDMYGSSSATEGNLIQSVTFKKNGSAQTDVIQIEEDYGYIGFRSGTGAVYINKITIEWEVASGTVVSPTIVPVSGTVFDESQNVTITSADGTTVWYTTDGSDPEKDGEKSIEYTVPFAITATTTVKAIAVNAEGKASPVASATYTKVEAIKGLATLVEQTNTVETKECYVRLNGAVVTGVEGDYAFLEEGETGILLHKSDHALVVGQKYSGLAKVSVRMYNGMPELTSFDCTHVEENVDLPLTIVSLVDLKTNYDGYLSRRVKIENVTVTTAFANRIGQITQDVTCFDVYARGEDDIVMALGDEIDLVAFPCLLNNAQQLNVLSQNDIVVKNPPRLFTFSKNAVSVREDADVIEPELINTYDDKAVTYTSSNEAVATVNAVTGEVAIVAAGETTITATLTGGQKATYTLTVTAISVKRNGCYYLVTSTDELVAGARYLIVSKNEGKAMAAPDGNNTYRTSTSIAVAMEDELSVIENLPVAAREFVLKKGSIGSDTWSFYDEKENRYLSLEEDENYINNTISTINKRSSATIEIAKSGNAEIVFKSYADRHLRYNAGYNRFACYTTQQTAIQLYKLYKEISIGTDGYASYYTDHAFIMPEGVEGGIVTAATENGNLNIEYNYSTGAIVPAKTGLLLKGTAGKYAYELAVSGAAAPANNLLHGANAVDGDGKMYVEGTNVRYYILSKKNGKNIGFYYAATGGVPVTYQAGKSFLAIDYGAAEVAPLAMFNLNDDSTTGFDDLKITNVAENRVYTLMGVYVGNNVKTLPKGIYIVNGKKVAF